MYVKAIFSISIFRIAFAYERFYIGLALVGFYRMWGACLFSVNLHLRCKKKSPLKCIDRGSRIRDRGSRIKGEHINSLNVDCVNGLNSVFMILPCVWWMLNVRMCMNDNMHDNLKFWITWLYMKLSNKIKSIFLLISSTSSHRSGDTLLALSGR